MAKQNFTLVAAFAALFLHSSVHAASMPMQVSFKEENDQHFVVRINCQDRCNTLQKVRAIFTPYANAKPEASQLQTTIEMRMGFVESGVVEGNLYIIPPGKAANQNTKRYVKNAIVMQPGYYALRAEQEVLNTTTNETEEPKPLYIKVGASVVHLLGGFFLEDNQKPRN